MTRISRVFLIIVWLGLWSFCACSNGDGTGPGMTTEINFVKHDGISVSDLDVIVSIDLPVPEVELVEEPKPDVPVVQTGCGDGNCEGAETPENCAKDCLSIPEPSAFVFAHKGDELPVLGRIYDLIQAGSPVFVFYLTFDETPLAEMYNNNVGTLAVASVGVPAENIYTYEQYIEWDIFSGNHEILDRLTQHFIAQQPSAIYLPQLCGADIEVELAHVVGLWAAKRSKVFPTYFEYPARSNYYVGTDADPELVTTDPDGFALHFTRRWKLLPKDTEEVKPTLGSEDMAQIRMAAGHILNGWLQEFLYKLPEDKLLFLLREMQRYRQLPPGQKPDKRPFLESIDNPGAKYIYEEQGFTFDEFKQRARVIESFFGTNLKTNPSTLPFYDEPVDLNIMAPFQVHLDIRSFSSEPDVLSFTIGFGPAKNSAKDCTTPEDLAVGALETTSVVISCKAQQPVGEHTYYFRASSKLADDNSDAAMFTEVPYRVNIGN
jgi:hypothetical protein